MFDDEFMNDILLNPDLYGLEDDEKADKKDNMKKLKMVKVVKMVKSSELRVYKDNSRPVVFDDKRRKEKYKKSLIEY